MKEEGIPLGNWVIPRVEKAMPSEYPDEPYLGLDDIEAHTARVIGSKCSTTMKSAAKRFYSGDVLYSRLRPYLNKVWLADRSGLCSAEFIVLPSNNILDGAFLKFRLNARDFVSFANSLNAGDRPRVDFEQISAFCLPPFALARQRQIVAKIEELFSELDAGEESLRTALRKLGVYRQSLLKQAFEGKLTERWRERNPDLQFSTVESAVTSDLLPLGWRYTTLGITIENPAYGTSKKCSYESGGLGVLRIPNIVKGAIDAADLKYAEFTNDEGASYELKPGDLLLIRSNGSVSIVGRCALVEAKHTGLLYAGYLIRLRPIKSLIDPLFLRTQLESLKLRSQIESSAKSTSGVNNINSKEIQRLVIALPSLPEQQEIVRLLDEQFTVIDQNEREIAVALKRSEALRQSILKKAFTGQLVPQNPTDEPASALLERIRKERENPIETGRASKK